MARAKMCANMSTGEEAHGRDIDDRDYTFRVGQGTVFLIFNASAERHEFDETGKYRVGEVEFDIAKLTPDFARVRIADDPVIIDPNYIYPRSVNTAARQAWLSIQEYYLADNYSDEALAKLCDLLDDVLFPLICKTHSQELEALTKILDDVEAEEFISALIEIRELVERIEGRSPASAPEPVNA